MTLSKYILLLLLILIITIFTNCITVGKRYYNYAKKVDSITDTLYLDNKGYFYYDNVVEICNINDGEKHGRAVKIYGFSGDSFSVISIYKYRHGKMHGTQRNYDKDWKSNGKNHYKNGEAKFIGGVSF